MNLVGLDECGRGALAGPLVACGCQFLAPVEEVLSLLPCPLNDSKKLTRPSREKIYQLRHQLPIIFHLVEYSSENINLQGIGVANISVFLELEKKFVSDYVIADGNLKFKDSQIQSVIKADTQFPQVMLASIIAKVHRDSLMSGYHQNFPQYGFDHNAGYGTASHLQALYTHGPCAIHRTKFIATALKKLTSS